MNSRVPLSSKQCSHGRCCHPWSCPAEGLYGKGKLRNGNRKRQNGWKGREVENLSNLVQIVRNCDLPRSTNEVRTGALHFFLRPQMKYIMANIERFGDIEFEPLTLQERPDNLELLSTTHPTKCQALSCSKEPKPI